uniref:Uncharacterized protein n=1 Tax=Sus scrofa TaxID=9823 RepID=A0A8W4FF09_PIG
AVVNRKTNRTTVHKSKQEGRQQNLLIDALGMKLGSPKSSVTLQSVDLCSSAYLPLTSFVVSQGHSASSERTLSCQLSVGREYMCSSCKDRLAFESPRV